jgi:hypothetical protein
MVKLPPRLTSLQFAPTGPPVALPQQVNSCDIGTWPLCQALLLLTDMIELSPARVSGLLINDCCKIADCMRDC